MLQGRTGWFAGLCVGLLAGVSACGEPPGACADATAWFCADASNADGGQQDVALSDTGGLPARPAVPYVAGEWVRVYAPSNNRYLNDHTLVRAPNGTWHLYGITHTSQGSPGEERSLLHATAPDIIGPWTDLPDILTADSAVDETIMWAPYAFERAPGQWTMFYTSSPTRPPLDSVLRRADSTDLTVWTRTEQPPGSSAQRAPGGRDAFAMRIGNEWWLYSVGVDALNRGQIVLSRNADLDRMDGWTAPVPVITDPVPNFGWGNLESPYVVKHDGFYYLFLTRTNDTPIDYVRTNVFRSLDPTHFDWVPITDIRAHAAEVIEDTRLGDLITSCGWTGSVGEDNRGMLLAPLRWAPQ